MKNTSVQAVRSYYHSILPFYEQEAAALPDLDFWRELAAECAPGPVLEIGAGFGRVTAALAERAPVVGFDLSREMLRHAARRPAAQPVQLLVADMRHFALAARFPLIVAASDPFSHLTAGRDRQAALRAAARHLAPGGRLVIDGLYFPTRQRVVVRQHRAGSVSVSEVWTPAGDHANWRAQFRYRRGARRQSASFPARSWMPEELAGELARAGLQLSQCWADYDRTPFHPRAERLIMVAICN